MIKDILDRNTLSDLYTNKMMTQKEISKVFGISHQSVSDLMKEYNLTTRNQMDAQKYRKWKKSCRIIITKDYLITEYYTKKRSTYSLAKENDCSMESIRRWLRIYNIPIRKNIGKDHWNWKPGAQATGRIIRDRVSWYYKKKIINRDNGICQICGKKCSTNEVWLDHIIPVSVFIKKYKMADKCIEAGVNSESNLQVLCKLCNLKKHDSYEE
jgi:transposase